MRFIPFFHLLLEVLRHNLVFGDRELPKKDLLLSKEEIDKFSSAYYELKQGTSYTYVATTSSLMLQSSLGYMYRSVARAHFCIKDSACVFVHGYYNNGNGHAHAHIQRPPTLDFLPAAKP